MKSIKTASVAGQTWPTDEFNRLTNLLFMLLICCVLPPVQTYAQETQTLTYVRSSENFLNPERGFWRQVNPSYHNTMKWLTPAEWRQMRTDGYSLVRRVYLLKEFRNQEISQEYLDAIRTDLGYARQSGVKVLPFFNYNWFADSNGQRPDAPVSIVLTHLDQLQPVFRENVDVIACLSISFVGQYGEWHRSTNSLLSDAYSNHLNANSRSIINKIMDVLPPERMWTARYPKLKWQYKLNNPSVDPFTVTPPLLAAEAYSGSAYSRIGHQNDSFLASDDDWSSLYPKEPTLDFLQSDTKYVIQIGEIESDEAEADQYKSCENAQVRLSSEHWSALTQDETYSPHKRAFDIWREQGCFDTIARSLGYRFRLINSTVPVSVNLGGTLSMNFDITNDGYAAPYNPRLVELILRSKQTGQVYRTPVNADPRQWLAGETHKVDVNWALPTNIAAGDYDVLLNLPDPQAALYGRAAYSIRLANQNVWEAATGYNSLLAQVAVTSAPDPTPTPTPTPRARLTPVPSGTGLKAEYFDDINFTSLKTTRTDPTVNFNWGSATPSGTALTSPDAFSVQWSGEVQAPVTGTYAFTTTSDDGVRLWVNNVLLINNWTNHAPTDNSATINLTAGQKYSIKMNYYEKAGGAVARLNWSYPGQARQIVPSNRLFPARVAAPIIIDNTDSTFSLGGTWTTSTSVPGYYGSNYLHDGNSSGADSSKWAKWTPSIASERDYDLYLRWTAASNRPDAVPLEIKHSGGVDSTKTVNQQGKTSEWVLIGRYRLSAGSGNYLKILASDAGATIADAAKFEPR